MLHCQYTVLFLFHSAWTRWFKWWLAHYGDVSGLPQSLGRLSNPKDYEDGGRHRHLTWFLIDQWTLAWLLVFRSARNLKWHLPEAPLERKARLALWNHIWQAGESLQGKCLPWYHWESQKSFPLSKNALAPTFSFYTGNKYIWMWKEERGLGKKKSASICLWDHATSSKVKFNMA